MSDLDNARYRLLSFKYTPTKPLKRDGHEGIDDDPDLHHDKARSGPLSSGGESKLPSLSSLAMALPVIDDDTHPSNNQGGPRMSDKETDPEAEAAAGAEEEGAPVPGPPVASFHLFGDLPAELRIKIWHLTFLPRVVELHPTRPIYARDIGRQQQWQSGCSNPAVLSVCSEARQIALGHFRIAYPLAAITTQQQEDEAPFARYVAQIGPYNFAGASASGKAILCRRTLHISPEHDTVALLGQDTDFAKLFRLRDSFRDADPAGLGISNLALSTRGWGHGGSAAMMRSLDRSIFKDLEQLTLFMYGEPLPPVEWSIKGAAQEEESLRRFRETGSRCELVPCEGGNAWYAYKLWSGGKGRQFWDEDGKIMRVGKNELKIMDLKFSDGW